MNIIQKFWTVLFFAFLFLFNSQEAVLAAPPTNFQTEALVTDGLDGPSGFEIAPDGRIFVLQRTGEIKIVKNGQLLAQPFAVLPSIASGDRGLIGIAFDPAFNISNHYVYFYYTGLDKLNRLVRFDASTDVGENGPYVIYQTSFPSENLHVGGSIRFGPDGKLYFAVGDNGYPPNAQNLGNPHGKILRINKDGSIPLDNPFYGQPGALPEIWAYGMRNPWRFQFDSATGKLYGGDVGDYSWEEINRIEKGKNYGWPTVEGMCQSICGTMVNPIYTYPHEGESSAVTGGPVYRGDMFPQEYSGSLFFGDYAMGFIRRLTLNENGDATGVYDFDVNAGSVVDLKIAPDGSLYYITYWPGRLYKVSYTTGNHKPTANATADDDKGIEPHTVHFSSAGSSDPDGDPITFFWKFGDGTTSTEANPVKTYTVKGTYSVELAVSDGVHTSNAVPVVIQVGIPPTVTIGEPADGTSYKAGDTIHYTVFALDGAGFDINDSDLSTEILLHHNTHIHPFLGPIIGRQGTFTIPTTGEASSNTWYEIKATANDENGLSSTKSIFINPIKSHINIVTSPVGLQVNLDGVPHTAPQSIEGVVNFERELNAVTIQPLNGKYYKFDHWSDNLPQKHFVSVLETDQTYTAYFQEMPAYNAEYYNNKNLVGTPVLTRGDTFIDFDWGDGSPDPLVNADNFSARWTKTESFSAGTYEFSATGDDGIRLYVDGVLLIDKWIDQSQITYKATKELSAGNHTIKFEYYDNSGGAVSLMNYTKVAEAPPAASYNAEYFNNKTLSGTASLTRNDQEVNFDWGVGSPDAAIPNDNFSARWTKTQTFEAGNYEFTTTADDGVRVKVDGETIIDKWIDQSPTTHKVQKSLTAGNHQIVVEYYENGGGAVAKMSFAKLADAPPTGGYSAEFYNNKTLTAPSVLTRIEQEINFDWGGGSPAPVIDANNFSARFIKTEAFTAGTYEFTITGDDGVRLFVDGELLLDKWNDQSPSTYKVNKTLAAGNHTIVMEYYENTGGAVAKLSYALITTPPPPPAVGYTAEFFNNKTLTAPAVITRNDAAIDFDWGAGSPAPAVTNDNFSARWTKNETLTASSAGTYEFTTTADDGIRVKVDGETIIDKWIDQSPTTHNAQKVLTAGNHTVIVEYYENGGGAVAKMSFVKVPDGPTPTPPADKFLAKYWNIGATGAPAIPVTPPTLSREETEINNDWKGLSPDASINNDRFVAQWTKTETITASSAGTYRFTTTSDDGIRVYVDNEPVIDKWVDQSALTHTGEKTLTAGQHEIRVEYFENGGDAVAKFSFEKVTVTPAPPPADPNKFHAEFFNNITLTGTAILTKDYDTVDFNWGQGTPDPLVNNEHFSVRITKTQQFAAGNYTFNVSSDDGVRVYIDDQLVLDDWIDHSLATHTITAALTEGNHTIKIEYFENFGDAVLKFLQN